MDGMFKEELTGTVKKKRFIILAGLAFAGMAVTAFITKNGKWNDLSYLYAVYGYLNNYFALLIGNALILSVYRKKYTNASIMQVEDHSKKRFEGVVVRFLAGSVIIVCSYVIAAMLAIILGLVLGAHNTMEQTGLLLLKTALDCVACIAAYAISLFWLYLFAFPVFPMLIYSILTLGMPFAITSTNNYWSGAYKLCFYVSPKVTADYAFTKSIFSNPKPVVIVIFLIQLLIPILLSVIVFNLKKLKPVTGN